MFRLSSLVVLLVACATFAGAERKLPSYLKPCSIKDPDFNKCAAKNGRLAIPFLAKGDPSYKIPPLDPLHVEEIRVDDGNPNSPAQLNLVCNNINISGLANSQISTLNFDFPNKKIIVSVYVPVVTALAKYRVTGKVLLLPIKGDGDCNITVTDLHMWYDIKYEMEKRKDGFEYGVIQDTLLNFNTSRAHVQLDNLFNGDKLLGDNVNKFLNDNWEDSVKEIGPVLAEAINAVFKQILVNVLDIVPFKNIFPEVV